MLVLLMGGTMNNKPNTSHPQESIFRGVLLAYLVLFLHVILILSLVAAMLLFGGVVTYLPWILAFGGALMVGSGYLWWKHMKVSGKKLGDILKNPLLHGRSVEVSFLGGLARLRLGSSQEPLTIGHADSEVPRQLQDSRTGRAEQLGNLAHLLKQDLITFDEFLEVKKELMDK